MRISRSCWDKPRRCPGWAGAGWNLQQKWYCRDGNIVFPLRWWGLGVCDECGVRVLPYWTRLLFPDYYWGMRGIYKMQLLWHVNQIGRWLMRWRVYRLGDWLHRL